MERNHIGHYWKLKRFSLFYSYFAYLDTDEYLADMLFHDHEVRVHYGAEYARKDSPYLMIFCKVRKRNEDAFIAALEELPNRMLLLGHTDYLNYWDHLVEEVEKSMGGDEMYEPDGVAEKA